MQPCQKKINRGLTCKHHHFVTTLSAPCTTTGMNIAIVLGSVKLRADKDGERFGGTSTVIRMTVVNIISVMSATLRWR